MTFQSQGQLLYCLACGVGLGCSESDASLAWLIFSECPTCMYFAIDILMEMEGY